MNSANSCLQGALEVSLRSASLNNLQKARLLDIMLWAGEYIHRAELQLFSSPDSLESKFGTQSTAPRSAYQKPQVKTRTTLLPQ